MTTPVTSPATSSATSPAAGAHDAGYSRVTLIGRHKRADLVLPSGEPIGALIPEVLAVLGEATAGDPRRLAITTAVGDLLPADATLVEAGVADGAVLRLVAEDEIPPPPVVNDITEETAADLESHRGRWGDAARSALTVAAAALLAALASIEVVAHSAPRTSFLAVLVAAGACWLAATVLAVTARRWLCVALACCAAAAAIVVAALPAAHEGFDAADRLGTGAAALWLALATAAIAWRARGPLLGAAFGLLLAGGWVGLLHSGLAPAEGDALVLLAAVVALGLLPRWAVGLSGLATLDDRRMSGEVVSRRALESSLVAAHSGLAWSAVAAASGVAIAGTALAISAAPWPAGLAGAAAVVSLLRARTMPLVAEVVAVVAGAACVLIGLELAWSGTTSGSTWPLVTTLVAAVLVVATLPARPSRHVRARLRGIADRAESLAVLTVLPLVIGVFGVYGRLLHTF